MQLYFYWELCILNVNFNIFFQIDTKVTEKQSGNLSWNIYVRNILIKNLHKFLIVLLHFVKNATVSLQCTNFPLDNECLLIIIFVNLSHKKSVLLQRILSNHHLKEAGCILLNFQFPVFYIRGPLGKLNTCKPWENFPTSRDAPQTPFPKLWTM